MSRQGIPTGNVQPQAAGVAATGIRRAAVIGAGSMGGGIAAQFANAGVPVDLLDIAGPEGARDQAALAGIDRQLKAGGFMHPQAAGLVRPGNVEDHMDRLAEADWIVEAVIENLDAKRSLYARIDAVRRPGTIVSSNTSTIPRADLLGGRTSQFASDFLITHFFNPPRHMRLVEFVIGAETDPAVLQRARDAAEIILGKTVVDCRDTPGFIANRIGCHWLAVALIEAKAMGLTPEEADAVMQAFGIPRTGAFGLMDLIGIDLVPHIWGSLLQTLPASDDLHNYDLSGDATITDMLARGRFGRKARAGFYRLGADKSRETLDFATGEYRPEQPVSPKALPGGGRDMLALVEADDRLGAYAWRVLSRVVDYTAGNGAEIAGDVGAIDLAMTLGYAWKDGPFQLADRIGVGRIAARLEAEGRTAPSLLAAAVAAGGFYDAAGTALDTDGSRPARRAGAPLSSLASARRGRAPIIGNDAASLWDIGDGIAVFEMHTKLNNFAPAVFDVLEETLARGGKDFVGLVLGNDDPRAFSAGADLGFILGLIKDGDMPALSGYIARGQAAFLALRQAPFPVVAAAHGLALGGGCEFTLHADAVVAHAEYQAGLPETKVGLVPGWGGCAQLLWRGQQASDASGEPLAAATRAFAMIMEGAPSGSAWEARSKGLLRPDDKVVMNRGHLLRTARDWAIELAPGYAPPPEATVAVTGASGKSSLMHEARGEHAAGRLTDADLVIAETLATVLTGGSEGGAGRTLSETEVMRLEREALVELSKTAATRARIEHMLATGKPLRN
ncbi:3-hydroxyacyl-CoA dehydrogenase/enoyl-CoA hydratase family protein [Devosia sp.]|uniref:3-hydroxyacyl-CoA dehydrogenase/enoyl-CoA hydratase family protein n=1 Tax=Devosia sp. TaxID=1871048 RepID=UPI002F1868D1